MAERITKITDYLNSNNHEAAMRLHADAPTSTTSLEPPHQLQLARTFFYIAGDFRQTIDILQRVQESKAADIKYEARMLLAKASHLTGLPAHECLAHLRELNGISEKYHQRCVEEVKKMIEHATRFHNGGPSAEEGELFQKMRREEEDNSSAMEGFPRFLVSRVWLQSWRRYVGLQRGHMDNQNQQRRHPGPITQFQLVDYPYRVLCDPKLSKDYTNRFLFSSASEESYEILPKKCWDFLRSRYEGIQVKRYNVSFVDRPYEIVTEVFLKRIDIANEAAKNFSALQISKKETWAGVKAKLARIWGDPDGEIVQLDEQGTQSPVNEGQFLQEVDTMGKRYLYRKAVRKADPVERCANKSCGRTEKLTFCKCKSVKYCNYDCAKADYKNHKKKCELEIAHNQQQSAVFKNFNLQEKAFGGLRGRVGLKNLGNTCYMNSGLQCLSNTRQMTEYFMSAEFKAHINYNNPLGTKGNLACTYAQLIRQMWTGSSDAVSPFKLKKVIGNFATQFSGYGQQDSQEFISYLIDGLSEDLNLVKKKETFETSEEIKPDEEMSRQSELNYAKRINSYVRNLMVGQFKSTVVCSTCSKVSVCFDPYLLISMPVPPTECFVFFVPTELAKCAIRLAVPLSYSSTTLDKVGRELAYRYNKAFDRDRKETETGKEKVVPERLLYVIIDEGNYSVLRTVEATQLLSAVHAPNHLIFCLQIPESQGGEAVLAEFRKDRQDGPIVSFPRFFKYPRNMKPSQKDEPILEALRRGVDQRRSMPTAADLFSTTPITQQKPFRKFTVLCKRDLKLLTYVQPQKAGISWKFQDKQFKHVGLEECLRNFSQRELLQGDNLWYCNRCKEHKEATRHLQVYKSNKILVIAFKRFNRMKKLNTPIRFPLENFDMSPFLLCNQGKPALYDLYGVVNHYGSLGAGHYTAYCQNFLNKKWYQFNDSRVSEISKNDVVSDSSYVLFYRKKDS